MTDKYNDLEVNIKTYHGTYVMADLNKYNIRQINTNNPDTWEIFRIIDLGNNEIAFKCKNGKYISAYDNSKNYGLGLLGNVDGWEKFKIVKKDNKWNIYSPHHKKYWSSYDNKEDIRASVNTANDWELFEIKIITNIDELIDLNTNIKYMFPTTQKIDTHLIGQNPNIYCGITNKNWYRIDSIYKIKPIFAYLRYIDVQTIPDGTVREYTFIKEKGIERSWGVSVEISQKISGVFSSFESSTEIKLKFDYNEKITEKTIEQWKDTVTGPKDYYVYQPAVIYAIHNNNNPYETRLLHLLKNTPFTTTNNINVLTSNQAEWIIAKNKEKWELEALCLNI